MEILNINLINIVIRNINKTWRLWLITILYFWYKIYNQIQATTNKKLDKLRFIIKKPIAVFARLLKKFGTIMNCGNILFIKLLNERFLWQIFL